MRHVTPLLTSEEHPLIDLGTRTWRYDYYTECIGATIGVSGTPNPIVRSLEGRTLDDCDTARRNLATGAPGRNYWRYWHGYQIFSRPALALMSPPLLRDINAMAVLGALLALLMTASRLLTPAALAVMASATLTPALSQLALFTHSLIWICAFALAAYLLRTPAQRRALSLSELFLLQGMLTAYFDLLTTPLIACTIPMIALCLLWRQDGVGLSTQVGQLAVCGIAWAVGYVGFWTAKCVLALWLVPGASLHDLLDVVAHRASDAADDVATGHHASRLDGIRWLAWQTRFTCLFVGALAALASIQAALRGRLRFDAKLLPLALVAAAPLGWAVVVLNHTVVHYWFVAPVLIPSFFIIAYLAIEHMLAGKAPAAAGAPA